MVQFPHVGVGRRWNSKRSVALLFVVLFAVPATAQETTALSEEERAWLDDHGPIRYAPDPSYPPFESVDDQGVTSGINVDLLNRMSRNLDFEVETVVYDNWTVVLQAMEAGEVDLLGSLAKTPDRETYMDFIGPYMQVGEVFYVREDSTAQTEEDLIGQTIGVIPSYAAAQWLAENRPQYTTVAVADTRDGLHKLSVGEIDAFFENIPVAADIIRKDALNNLRILGEPLYFSESNWGVTKGDPILYSIISKGMASISPGEQTKVFEYWSGYDLGVTPDPTGLSPVARNALIGLAAFAAAVTTWSVSLRQTVRRRTRDLQESQDEVMKLNANLEQRVMERTTALEEANDALKDFSSAVSHDLKTPLSSIATYGAALEVKHKDHLDEEGIHMVRRIGHAAKTMGTLIDDMLRLSQTAQAEMHLEKVDASALAHQILEDLQATEPERKVSTTVMPNIELEADPTLLRTILSNLLENAWKYTRDTEEPAIQFGSVREDGRQVCFVSDNGIGIDPHVAETLFRPFSRAPEADSFEGTGIGLATVWRGVKRHGGHVWAQSNRAGGATFFFDLHSTHGQAGPHQDSKGQ